MKIIDFPVLENLWFHLAVVGALISLATFTWQFRNIPGAKPQVCSQIIKGLWLLSRVLISDCSALADKIFWYQIYTGASFLSSFVWFVFVLEISRQETQLPSVIKRGIQAAVVGVCLVILSNPWHGLIAKDAWLDGQTLMVAAGAGNSVLALISFSLCLMTVVLSIRWILITVGLRRRQALWFTLASLFSLLGPVLVHIQGKPWPLPLGFLLTGFFITWGFYRWKVYNIFPLAQQTVVENSVDGLLVIDEYGYIADKNSASTKMLEGLPAFVGGKYSELIAAWPPLGEVGKKQGVDTMEAAREVTEGRRYYQLTVNSFQVKGHWLGQVVILKDITEQKQSQIKLIEQQKALSIMAERDRLGRELHDGHGQLWSYINMQVEAARSLLTQRKAEQADQLLKKLAEVTQDVHIDIRESITGLKTVTSEQGVWQTLAEYLKGFEQNYGITTEFLISPEFGDTLLSPVSEVQVLRVIQEALTNIRKHARARQVKISVGTTGISAQIAIEDDGRGFDAVAAEKKGSFGLKIMQERAEEIGGQLWIESKPGFGTRVLLQVPLAVNVSHCPEATDTEASA